MANINLYLIDSNKVDFCIRDLSGSAMKRKETKLLTINKDDKTYDFGVTLYLEPPYKSDDEISWNWLLEEFKEPTIKAYKAPKAVLLIEKTINDIEKTYAITFGSSYFRVDKYCDRDFGFNFASRMEYTNVKTTTLTAPNLQRSKTVNTYINYNELDFDSGESFSKLKVNAKLDEKFTLFKSAIEIGNSIRFTTDDETINGVLNIILHVEEVLKIPDEDVRYKIPLFQLVRDDTLLTALNKNIRDVLSNNLLGKGSVSLFSIPELEIIGATEIFNRTDDEFALKYPRLDDKKITNLTIETIRTFLHENDIKNIENVEKIKIVRFRDGESVVTTPLLSIIEYTDDENKCIFSNGKWYFYNRDYLTYLNESVDEIEAVYNPSYDFDNYLHNQFIEEYYILEKDDERFVGKTATEIKKMLKKKYYAERYFNIIREQEGDFDNYDREDTASGVEKMDLYEKKTSTMFAVKKGKSSSDLCYAVDQSLTALRKYKHGEISKMPAINNVGLWFILERKTKLTSNEQENISLSSLNMLMLKNRIDQWKKEVRLAGYKPIIYINYR